MKERFDVLPYEIPVVIPFSSGQVFGHEITDELLQLEAIFEERVVIPFSSGQVFGHQTRRNHASDHEWHVES